ncbi:MAG TPA: NADH-quinone oxidoreductase subunit J [Candidatus Dormibacteraeota bacterium]|nr:NADH-quinone oxidoreductase subunit J [Candidatus Dormibacteraeota bacterium]
MTDVNPAAFYLLSALVVGGAIAVVTVRNLVHAAFCLIGTLVAVGALYFAVGADFIAGAQILVYAGAIPVLLIFGLMLTRGSMTPEGNGFVRLWPVTALVALAFASTAIGVVAVGRNDWRLADYPQSLLDSGTTETLGRVLLGRYAIPFEAASVLLLVALVGAVTLARRDERELEHEESERSRRERLERIARRRRERERARGRGALAAEAAEPEAGS